MMMRLIIMRALTFAYVRNSHLFECCFVGFRRIINARIVEQNTIHKYVYTTFIPSRARPVSNAMMLPHGFDSISIHIIREMVCVVFALWATGKAQTYFGVFNLENQFNSNNVEPELWQ